MLQWGKSIHQLHVETPLLENIMSHYLNCVYANLNTKTQHSNWAGYTLSFKQIYSKINKVVHSQSVSQSVSQLERWAMIDFKDKGQRTCKYIIDFIVTTV